MKKDYTYVIIQFILIICFFLLFNYRTGETPFEIQVVCGVMVFVGVGLVIIPILQINKFISVLPTPVKGSKLVTTGAFKYIRHPIYAGIILGGVGLAFMFNNFIQLIIIFILYLLFELKSEYEEQQLFKKFPEYLAYKKHTGKFFPIMK